MIDNVDPEDDEPIFEDGVEWRGTRESLQAWKAYKQDKAIAFVHRGYSVEWYPDGDNWMDVYLPQRDHARAPELRACVKFFKEPSRYGIDCGRVSKLSIQSRQTDLLAKLHGHPHETVETLFNYDRGYDVDRMDEEPLARVLYDAILHELN